MQIALGAAAITAAVLVIYARSLSGYFFDDDFHWLAQSQTFEAAHLLNLSRYNHFYRPVIEIYFAAGLRLFGCDPFPFHLASLAIHLLTIGSVWLLARALSASLLVASLGALFFAVQPGFTEAVTWIGAITDQLPVLWYVLALWLHLRFLRDGLPLDYAAAVVAFVLCHLTHESAVSLLPMMLLLHSTFAAGGSLRDRLRQVVMRARVYWPFALLLAGYLALAYVVNMRSYLVQEGHYAIGLHALPNILNYFVWLYIGRRSPLDYSLLLVAIGAIVVWGTPRMRFSLGWMIVTLVPVSFFTWENAPRYLYLPAVGFALLVADLLLAGGAQLRRWITLPIARAALLIAVVVVAGRFGVFARKAADSFPARTAAYRHYVEELRRLNPTVSAGGEVVIGRAALKNVPELYREPAARVGLCLPGLRVRIE